MKKEKAENSAELKKKAQQIEKNGGKIRVAIDAPKKNIFVLWWEKITK